MYGSTVVSIHHQYLTLHDQRKSTKLLLASREPIIKHNAKAVVVEFDES